MTLCPSTSRSPRIAERGGSRLTRIWAGLYTRPRMGTDSIQPSRRLPTTASRAAADLAAPVLSAAPLMRVAHSRHASVRPTADRVGRKLHRSTPAGVAGTSIQTTDTSVPDHSCRRQMRARSLSDCDRLLHGMGQKRRPGGGFGALAAAPAGPMAEPPSCQAPQIAQERGCK